MEVSVLIKEFVHDASKGYGFVVCNNYGVVLLREEYGDAMFPFVRYCFLGVAL